MTERELLRVGHLAFSLAERAGLHNRQRVRVYEFLDVVADGMFVVRPCRSDFVR